MSAEAATMKCRSSVDDRLRPMCFLDYESSIRSSKSPPVVVYVHEIFAGSTDNTVILAQVYICPSAIYVPFYWHGVAKMRSADEHSRAFVRIRTTQNVNLTHDGNNVLRFRNFARAN